MPDDAWSRLERAERPLRVKFGIDATHHRLHLGHLVPLRLCRSLQERGHVLHLVLGTLTGRLGDPSGRDQTRPILTEPEVQANASGLLEQCRRVLLPGFVVHLNHTFVDALSVPDFLVRLAGRQTVAGLLARDGFRKRMAAGQPIAAHELLVPLLQGWDSVVLRAEIEIGGTDQLFNFQLARSMQRAEGNPAQDVLMRPLLRGPDGKKMSKSAGNAIPIDTPPEDMFARILSIPDALLQEWSALLTEIETLPHHPLEAKKAVASAIVEELHGQEAALRASAHFEQTVQRKQPPEEVPQVAAADLLTLVATVRGESRNRARRLIEGGGVRVEGQKALDPRLVPAPGALIWIGRQVVRVG